MTTFVYLITLGLIAAAGLALLLTRSAYYWTKGRGAPLWMFPDIGWLLMTWAALPCGVGILWAMQAPVYTVAVALMTGGAGGLGGSLWGTGFPKDLSVLSIGLPVLSLAAFLLGVLLLVSA